MGIMLNEDCNHFIATRKDMIQSVDEKYLQNFIDQYKDTLVTDFVMNISATISFVPSKVIQFAGDKYLVKEELGRAVDYSKTELSAVYHLWYEKKLDMYRIWIDRCRHNGINPWISIRMNDAELVDIPNHLLSEYYYEHVTDYAVVRHREPKSALEYCRDYRIEEYRNQQLAYMEEMLERYDVYGIELDFQRELYCLQIGMQWDGSETMTAFMKSVKAVVKKAEVGWGHKIKISVRCHAHPEDSRELGFDIPRWARLGLIDLVIPSPNWITTDNAIPLYLWKDLLEGYGVEVVGCIERQLNSNPEYAGEILKDYAEKGFRRHSYETLCASAVVMLSEIPEKIYLFNHMDCPEITPSTSRWAYTKEDYEKIMKTISDTDAILHLPRRHVVTYSDTVLPWKKCDNILPITFDKELIRYIRIPTGKIPEGMQCILRMGIQDYNENAEIFANSTKVSFLKKTECEEPVLTSSPLYCYEIPFSAIQSRVQIVEIIAEHMKIDYADLICIPKSE